MTVKLKNNVRTALAASLAATATTMQVVDPSAFPVIGVGEYYYLTIQQHGGITEIVRVTSAVGYELTIVRGVDGTTASAFPAGAIVELRVTAASVLDAAQDAAAALTLGDLGVTASVAELNILDGVTASTAEINLLDGVTATTPTLSAAVANSTQTRDTVALLRADTALTYVPGRADSVAAGQYVRTRSEGFAYQVAASGATDHHVTTAGGVKLYVLPGNAGYNVKAFGALGDNSADDTAEVQKMLDALKANGGIGIIPKGNYRLTALLSISSATKAWALVGEDGAKLIRAADYGSVISVTVSNNWRIENIEIDAGFSSFATNANHGIVWYNCSNVLVRRCRVTNYKNTAIIGYTSPASLTYTNNVIEDCVTDGLDVANNGILLADLFRSGLRNCQVLNVGKSGSPCYALQLKNGCQEGFIEGGRATGGTIGIAMGNYDVSGTHYRNRVSGVHVFDCDVGIAFGNAKGNLFSDLVIDMNNAGLSAVDFNLNSVGCAGRNIAVHNLAAGKSAVRCRSGDTDNVVHLSTIENDSGLVRPFAEFNSGAVRNTVNLDRYVNPTTVTSTTSGLISDTSGVSTNRASLLSFPLRYSYTIASDAITLNGPHVTIVRVDTESSASTDDLLTINGGVDGQTITLNTTVNARDVVVKHSASGANTIRLDGSADFTLDNVGDRLLLQYDGVLSQWCEVGRGNNI